MQPFFIKVCYLHSVAASLFIIYCKMSFFGFSLFYRFILLFKVILQKPVFIGLF